MELRRHKQRLGAFAYQLWGGLWNFCHPRQTCVAEPATILVINLLRIGDTVVTLPAMEALRRSFPRAQITCVVRSLTAPLVNHLDCVDDVVAHDGDNSRSSCARLVSKLPQADLAVIFDTSPWTSWAARRAGAISVVAYDSLNRGFAATRRVPAPPMWNVAVPDYQPDWEVPTQCDAWMDLAVVAGASARPAIPVWSPPKAAHKRSAHWLESRDIAEFVHVHPGSDPSYQWPVQRWRDYVTSQDLPVVVGGAAFERDLLETIAKGQDGVHVWCQEGDLAEYGALLEQAQHVASVDTSAAHLAAAAGTPVSVLFGPGDPQIWGPRGNATVDILSANTECRGCKAATCHLESRVCMESISLEQLMQSQRRLL